MRDTLWIYVNLLVAWVTILLGLYILSILVSYIRGFNSSILLNVSEVLIAVILFFIWLLLWRLMTLKLFKSALEQSH